MDKGYILSIAVLIALAYAILSVSALPMTYNPFTGKLDYYSSLNQTCSSGYFFDEILTNGSFACSIVAAGAEIDPRWQVNFTNQIANPCTPNFVSGIFGNGTFRCATASASDITWIANWSAYNTTWSSTTNTTYDANNVSLTNFINSNNVSVNNYIVYYADLLNTSQNNYILENNNSVNNNIDSKLITTFFNATTNQTITGTPSGIIDLLQLYDGISYNVTEVSSDMELIVNFTSITEFNQIVVRYKSSSTENHVMVVYLWDYTTSSWESYLTIGNTENEYVVLETSVFDQEKHISGEVVQVRFYSNNLGGSTHLHQFDWVTISKGIATPSGDETDQFAIQVLFLEYLAMELLDVLPLQLQI